MIPDDQEIVYPDEHDFGLSDGAQCCHCKNKVDCRILNDIRLSMAETMITEDTIKLTVKDCIKFVKEKKKKK